MYSKNTSDNQDFNVRLGDVLGVTLPNTLSAELYMGESTKRLPYKTNVNMVPGSLLVTTGYNNTALNYVPLVRATYFEPSSFAISLNCSIGHFIDTFNISDAKSFEIHQARYTCTERIRNVSYEMPPHVTIFKPFNITIYKHLGYNVTHLIQFNNTDNITKTFRRVDRNVTFQHTFVTAGVYNVDLTAWNLLGAVNKRCIVKVQEGVYQVIQHRIPPAILTRPTNISWTIVNGTDTHCNVTFGDGTTKTIQTGTVNQRNSFWVTRTYSAVGEYWVNVSCGNLVSQVSNSSMAIIEKPIPSISCSKTHSSSEVNETVTFQTNIPLGITNVLGRSHFGDGRSNETRFFQIYSSLWTRYRYYLFRNAYSTWGVFLCNITLFNNVSSKTCFFSLKVHKPVYPIVISSLTATKANVSTPTAFMMNITSGNDFECSWNFGNSHVRNNGSGFYNLGTYVYKTYSAAGCYTVKVTCVNRLYTGSASTTACVYHPITNLVLTAPAAHNIHTSCPVSFSVTLGTQVSFKVEWINLLTQQTVNVTINSYTSNALSASGSTNVPMSNFASIGVYQVVLSAINPVTPLHVRTKIVHVELPITNFITTSSHMYIQVGHIVKLHSSVTSGSNVTVTWDFKDGTAIQTRFHDADTFKLSGDNVSHAFADHGLYQVRCTASNPLGSISAAKNIYVQYQVKNLSLTTNSPQIIPPGTTTFTLTVPDNLQVPTDAFIDVDFESNRNYRRRSFGTSRLSPFTKTITAYGLYTVKITVYNQISTQQLNTTIDVQRVIKNLVVTPVHTAGDAGIGSPGRGVNKNIFPREYPIRFNAATTDGSNITYYIDYGDGLGIKNTQEHYSTHQYDSKGDYVITVIANNSVSEMSVTISITLMDSNLDLVFDSNCPTLFSMKTTFQLNLTQIGGQACCLVDLLNSNYLIYKDDQSTICRSDWAGLTQKQNVFPRKHNTSVTFSHKYEQIRYYHVKASCHNTVSYSEKYHWVIMVPLPCAFPKVKLKDIGRTYTRPKRYVQSKAIKVYSDNSVHCYVSRKTEFIWTIFSLNSTGHSKNVVPLVENAITNRSILELPARSLPIGKYMFALNVSVVNLVLVDRARTGYVEIVPSPLQCFVYGGNGWSQSMHRDLLVDAQYSYDPDEAYENRTVGMDFFLYCKKNNSNYTFPENPVTDTNEQARGGGCTTRDAGFVSKDIAIKAFHKNTLKKNDSLHFRLYCRKGSRLGSFDLFVKITDKDPPQCFLR